MSYVPPAPSDTRRQPGFTSTGLIALGLAVLFLGGALVGPFQPVGAALLVVGGLLLQVGVIAKGVQIGIREARD